MSGTDERDQDRHRLRALRMQRRTLAFSPDGGGESPSSAAPPGGGWEQIGRGLLARLMLGSLLQAPKPGTTPIPGTKVTEEGVTKFMDTLRNFAARQGAVGSRAASRIVEFLTQSAGADDQMVAGVSLTQLKKLLSFVERQIESGQGAMSGEGAPQGPGRLRGRFGAGGGATAGRRTFWQNRRGQARSDSQTRPDQAGNPATDQARTESSPATDMPPAADHAPAGETDPKAKKPRGSKGSSRSLNGKIAGKKDEIESWIEDFAEEET